MVENFPPYTPMPSLGHELGIMFGFIAACLVVMAVYAVIWQAVQRKSAAKDAARRRDLQNRGFYQRDRSTAVHEKMLDRYASPANRVELPGEPGAGPGTSAPKVTFERTVSPLSASSGKIGNMRELL